MYFSDWLNTETMPKEFIGYVNKWTEIFQIEYERIKNIAYDAFYNTQHTLGYDATRKLYALAFTSSNPAPYPAILFAMLDGNTELADSLIWEACKPLLKDARPLWENKDE